MIETGKGGSIVNLASVAAYRCSPNGVHYAASKAGVIGLTRALALDLAPHGFASTQSLPTPWIPHSPTTG